VTIYSHQEEFKKKCNCCRKIKEAKRSAQKQTYGIILFRKIESTAFENDCEKWSIYDPINMFPFDG